MYMAIQFSIIVIILYNGKSFIFKKKNWEALVLFVILTAITWVMYWKAALKDPGYVRSNSVKVDSEPSSQDEPHSFLQNRAPSTVQ